MTERFEHRAIISGIGMSQVGRRLGRDELELTCDATLAAIADAGLRPSDIDGLATYPGRAPGMTPGFAGPGTFDVQDMLRLNLRWHYGGSEGPGQLGAIVAACLAVAAGLARHVLVYRTVTESTAQGSGRRRAVGAGAERADGYFAYLLPFGSLSGATWQAVYAARYMHDYGATREQFAQVALNGRRHAQLNPNAVYREPMTLDDYMTSRPVATPFVLYDCDVPCDGSVAFIVSAAEVARDLPQPPVRFEAVGTAIGDRASWDQRLDLTGMAAQEAGAMLWQRTALKPGDVDVAQLYDGFSYLTIAWLEALGFCGRGEGAAFVEGGARIGLGGALPLNTWGGQLSGGRLHGFGHLHEACVQLRGQAGARQVAGAEVAAVSAGGGPLAGCLLLTT
jgi:acetyl-CoA acetyltransferase